MSTRKIYEQELTHLKDTLEEMSTLVEASLNHLFFAIDHENEDLSRQIIRDDRKINSLERSIESQCLFLITTQQPIADDLRTISSILKVVTDVERIGDHASDIAEVLLRLNHRPPENYSVHLRPMIQAAGEMVHNAVSAFLERNREQSDIVIASDDVVDSLFNKVKDDIADKLRSGAAAADESIDVLMIAKYLERIGDHAVNICEWEIFGETGAIEDTLIF